MKHRRIALLACWVGAAFSQTPSAGPLASCASIADNVARLACYDAWGKLLQQPVQATSTPPAIAASSTLSHSSTAAQASDISRFWDLDKTTARETFELRGYRPISISVLGASRVNSLPNSPINGSPATATPYSNAEMRINFSVRTKLASGLLHQEGQPLSDSLWFAYSQQSHWQLFNGAISRPFRATDHEPELISVFGHQRPLPAGWTHRMSGIGLVHHSNGQSLPLSRSWNRVYVMAAADKVSPSGNHLTLQIKGWQRLPEKRALDDNPDISNFYGRAELAGTWSFNRGSAADLTKHTLGLTLRHSLRTQARGSVRLEYLRSLGDANSGLRFHAQLFSGYADSLIDYNYRRTVLSFGLSLVDW